MRYLTTLLCVLSVLLLAAPATAQESEADPIQRLQAAGPLPVLTPFILSLGFLDLQPTSAAVLPQGDWQAKLTLTGANYFASSTPLQNMLLTRDSRAKLSLEDLRSIADSAGGELYFADAESYRTDLVLGRGVGHRMELYVVIPVISAVGGRLDGVIEGFHSAFGLSQEGRQAVPRDDFTVFLSSDQGELYIGEPPGISLGDVSLGAKVALRSTMDGWNLTLNGEAKAPTGHRERLAGSGSVDLGTQLLALWMGRRYSFHGAAGVRWLGPNDLIGTDRQTALSALVGLERQLGRRTSALVQLSVSQGVFRQLHLSELNDTAIQGTLGLKHLARRGNILFLGVTENIAYFGNTPDVAFHLGWMRRFSARRAP